MRRVRVGAAEAEGQYLVGVTALNLGEQMAPVAVKQWVMVAEIPLCLEAPVAKLLSERFHHLPVTSIFEVQLAW